MSNSKILGFLKKKEKVIKKIDSNNIDDIYFRMYCEECGADYVIKLTDMYCIESLSESKLFNAVYQFKCPNCTTTANCLVNAIFFTEHWCDKDGNYMLENGEHFYIDKMLYRADYVGHRPFEDEDYVPVENSENNTQTEDDSIKDEIRLNKTSDYESITEKSVPETQEFNEEYDCASVFYLTKVEYIQLQNFHKVHNDCMIDPVTGMHRFGAIGGGISVRYITKPDGSRSVVAHCDYCNTTKKLSEDTDTCLTAEEIMKIEEQYKHYHSYPDKMDKVEYLKYKKFCEDRTGETISVGFMGTGLGSLITVKSETTGEYADITDIDSW